jgi:hypothetical protein
MTDFDAEVAGRIEIPQARAAVNPFFVMAGSSPSESALLTISPPRLVLSRTIGVNTWQASPEILSLRL